VISWEDLFVEDEGEERRVRRRGRIDDPDAESSSDEEEENEEARNDGEAFRERMKRVALRTFGVEC
jgi:hypothetical protein